MNYSIKIAEHPQEYDQINQLNYQTFVEEIPQHSAYNNSNQILVDKFDGSSAEERFAMLQKQKMGISSWHHESAEGAEEYVKSEDYSNHTNDERYERLKEIYSQSDISSDILNSLDEKEETGEIPLAHHSIEEEGREGDIEFDEEDEGFLDELLDDEQQQVFNE